MSVDIDALLDGMPFALEQQDSPDEEMVFGYLAGLTLAEAGKTVPPHWSRARDRWLRQFAKRSDPIKISVKTFISKALTIPTAILPIDSSVNGSYEKARLLYRMLSEQSGLMGGLEDELSKVIRDYLTQDNGGYAIILGRGDKRGPIVGPPLGIVHVDSQWVTRTGNPEYPITYQHTDGKRYAIYYTRVLDFVHMPDPDRGLNGVGLCPLSLCLDAAAELGMISDYSAESFGARPARKLVYAKQGATLEQLKTAAAGMESRLDAQGLRYFAKTMFLAPKMAGGKLELDMLDLSTPPTGFDRQSVTMIDLAFVVASFGLDLRDVSFAFGVQGQTRSDAEVSHKKGFGKGVGELVKMVVDAFDRKYLPDGFRFSYDFADDGQDVEKARVTSIRSASRSRDVVQGVLDVRTARIKMVEDEEITQAQFEELELGDGRLSDGSDVLSLFFIQEDPYTDILDMMVENPLAVEENDPAEMIKIIDESSAMAWSQHYQSTDQEERKGIRQAIAALAKLREMYTAATMQQQMLEGQEGADPNDPAAQGDQANSESNPENQQGGSEDGNSEAGASPGQSGNADRQRAGVNKESIKASSIRPEGWDKPLPPIPEEVVVTPAEVNRIIAVFNEMFPNYAGLLEAPLVEPEKARKEKEGPRIVYDPSSFRYRNLVTGRYISERNLKTLMDSYEKTARGAMRELSDRLATSDIGLDQWVREMRARIKEAYTIQYLTGRGGRNAMGTSDWGRVGGLLRVQYGYLNRFANDIAAGNMSSAQIAARAALYIDSSTQAFERAKTEGARGMPPLPAYPGDGTTECLSNCKCRWVIRRKKGEWHCHWTLGIAEHCDSCVTRSGVWNPYILPA